MNRDDLTPRQLEAIEATDDLVLVLGGAGAGKTTTALWAAREHLTRPVAQQHERVLFATFSRTAVSQIARRAPALLVELGDRVEIQTFHSLAYRLVRAFGRFAGYPANPVIESEARARILGYDAERLTYDALFPAALRLLESPHICDLAAARWTLVICDEFQDTSSPQWELLQALGANRKLLLADPNQMIYDDFIPTVGPQRMLEARTSADRIVELEERSHRDPSGVIPAVAAAVRRREFDHEAVRHAARDGRLRVLEHPETAVAGTIAELVKELHGAGLKTMGVFETTNDGVALLAAELTERDIHHALIGVPEAHGEATLAMGMLFANALGVGDFPAVRVQLAIFAAACTRSRREQLPELIARPGALRDWQEERMRDLERALREAEGVDGLLDTVLGAWEGLGMGLGVAAWRRAAGGFAAFVRRLLASSSAESEQLAQDVLDGCERLRTESAITMDVPAGASIQLMNLFQTKGREADAVIVVYREGGYVTSYKHEEPFHVASRVLYVALTRAREQVIVLLPPTPHALVAGFAKYCDR